MLMSRSRIIFVTLAVGALTMLVPGAALAGPQFGQEQPPRPAPPGPTPVPLCDTFVVLTGTPFCPPLSPG